jgi:cupin 2 domain-containing protein
MKISNIFDTSKVKITSDKEHFEALCKGTHARIERIISRGHTTPDGQWYDQSQDEWVMLLQGKAAITFFDGKQTELTAGDHLLLPAGIKHRVSYTSKDPDCIWLAVHFT